MLFFLGKPNWVSIASDGVTSGMQSALIASHRAAQGNTTAVNSGRQDSATRLAQANLAYAAQNADQGSMLSKPLADGGMKASNTAMTAMQWAASSTPVMGMSCLCCLVMMPVRVVALVSH